jgi:hypothetical protein
MTYLVGLALTVLGGGLLPGAFVFFVGIVLVICGAALIARAVERLDAAPVGLLPSLSGGLLLIVGLLGAIPLPPQCGEQVQWGAAGMTLVPWYGYLLTGLVCVVWPGVICVGAWLRRPPAWPTLRFIWLSLAATYLASYVVGLALSPFLPRSL